jgi:hypothetical protein
MTIATIEPPVQSVKIEGANYTAFDSKDGFYVIRDVPFFAEVPKGVKDAPEDIGKDFMQRAVDYAQTQYRNGKFASPVHKGHNKTLEISDPEFLGYFLPKRVGTTTLEGKEQYVTYADLKLKASAFDRAWKGELPYLSPEVDWATNSFSSLSFLDSKPPHFKFPMFTIGGVVSDPTAKFEAVLRTKFDYVPDDKKEERGKKEKEEEKKESGHCPHCDEHETKMAYMMEHLIKKGMAAMADEKPTATPVEQPKGTALPGSANARTGYEEDPKAAAVFAAQEGRIAALEEREKQRLDKERVDGLVTKAMGELKGYPVSDSIREKVAKFARGGEELVNEFVKTYKEAVPKDPPKSVSEYEQQGVSVTDPVLAKFAQAGPDKLEKAMKFFAEYKQMKQLKMPIGASAEEYINSQFKILEKKAGGN